MINYRIKKYKTHSPLKTLQQQRRQHHLDVSFESYNDRVPGGRITLGCHEFGVFCMEINTTTIKVLVHQMPALLPVAYLHRASASSLPPQCPNRAA